MDRNAVLMMAFLYYSDLSLAIQTTVYIKTSVLQDKCFRSWSSTKVSARSVLSCSVRCSSNTNCKQYMVCPDNSNGHLLTCEMFTEGLSCVVPEGIGGGCECYTKKSSCINGSCDCVMGYYGNNCASVIKDCIKGADIFYPSVPSAYSFIQPHQDVEPFIVYCDFQSQLSTFHNRDRTCSDINFNRTYSEYVAGFGNPYTDFWLGLKRIKLLVDIVANPKIDIFFFATTGNKQIVYTNAAIGDPSTNYRLTAKKGWGELPDRHFVNNPGGLTFSTVDRDNTSYLCPATCGGGWWYPDNTDCCNVNLNGPHGEIRWGDEVGKGNTTRVFMRVGMV